MTIKNNKLSAIELKPEGNINKVIIWLHGLGADGNDFAPIVPELNLSKELGIKFIFPNAPSIPVTINNGYVMPAWFDIYSPDIASKVDTTGIAQSVADIHTLIDLEISNNIKSEDILLAGFSQGAVIALTAALTYPSKLAGIIALSGLFPNAAEVLSATTLTNTSLPIFMAHGTQDAVVPIQLGDTAKLALDSAGFHVDWHTYSMAHGVCPEEISDIATWLKKLWS